VGSLGKVKIFKKIKFAIALCCLAGCGLVEEPTYSLGLVPSSFPLALQGKEAFVFGFIDDLFKEIGKVERAQFYRIDMNWDNLDLGLKSGLYEGMISSMPPHLPSLSTYHFSDLFLETGPVLVTPYKSRVHSFKDLSKQRVGVMPHSVAQIIVEREPMIYIEFFETIAGGFANLALGAYEGILAPNLQAMTYVEDLYLGELKVAAGPFTDEGLRLVTLTGEHDQLIKRFNRGLKKLKRKGIYKQLLMKWDLGS